MNVLWLVLVAGLMAVVQAVVFGISGLKKVTYRRYFDRRSLFEGEKVDMVEEIRNNKLLPLPWVRVESRIPGSFHFPRQDKADLSADETHHRSVFSLSPYTHIRRRHHITCERRGYYNLNSVSLTTGDILGIHSTSRTDAMHGELVVYPRLLDPKTITVPSNRWQGDVLVHRWILPDPFLINGIRDYRAGDPLRDVHWAATARTGKLQTKTHDFTADLKLLLCVNVQLREDQWGNLNDKQAGVIEEAISTAATLADWAVNRGVEVGFASNGQVTGDEGASMVIPPRSSREHLSLLLEGMARLRVRRRVTAQVFLDELAAMALTGMDIVFISHYWSPLLEEKAARLREQGNAVTVLPVEGGKA